MDWLITTKADVDMDHLLAKLSNLGCVVAQDMLPTPLDENEQVIEVSGPNDLPNKVADDDVIIDIYPNSQMTFY